MFKVITTKKHLAYFIVDTIICNNTIIIQSICIVPFHSNENPLPINMWKYRTLRTHNTQVNSYSLTKFKLSQ